MVTESNHECRILAASRAVIPNSGMHAFATSVLRIILGTLGGLFLLGTCMYFVSEPDGGKRAEPTEQERFGVKTFATATVSFDYPATWTAEQIPAPDGETIVRVLPPDDRASRLAMSLVVTHNAEVLAASKPVLGKGMTALSQDLVIIDNQPGYRVESSGVAPSGSYSHSMSWQFSNPMLHIAFTGTASGEPEDPKSVDHMLCGLMRTFDESASSLKFHLLKPSE